MWKEKGRKEREEGRARERFYTGTFPHFRTGKGGTELQGWKTRDWKTQDKNVGFENSGKSVYKS